MLPRCIDMQYDVCNSFFFKTFNRPERIKVYYGGSGSAKSLSLLQHFVILSCSGDGKRRAIFRKHFPSMKGTTYLALKDLLKDWKIPYDENKQDHVLKFYRDTNGEIQDYHGKDDKWPGTINELYYYSLDDPEKIKGGEYSSVWFEEANEFKEEDYNQLRLRLNRTSEDAVIYLSFNPVDKDHWVITKVVNRAAVDKRIFVHHSTYKNNIRFLSNAFIEELESYVEVDENFYRVYTLGLPGVLKGQIYKNWLFEDPEDWPDGLASAKHMYGIDFGYNAPMAMVEIWVYDEEYYIRELLYERSLTTNDLLERFESFNIDKSSDIYSDSAEPDRIQELRNFGYNSRSSKKDVRAGIDYVKGRKIHVDATNSPNIYSEYNNYKWKEDKDGKSMDEPVKAFDHLMDAIRYPIFSDKGEEYKSIGSIGSFGF